MTAGAPDPAGRAVRRLVHRVGDDLVELLGPGAGRTIAAAVSGGADSTAMLLALADGQRRTGWSPRAVHVDHGIAPPSVRAGFRRAAARAAELAGVPFACLHVDAPAELADGGGGMEAAARRARYRALAAEARRSGAAAIATAHTRSDQAETVLMRIIRGGPTAALAGIPPVGPVPHDDCRPAGSAPLPVARPLLHLARADAELLCAAWGAEPCRDPSNDDPAVLRARLRGEVLPLLRTLNPRIEEALAALASAVREREDGRGDDARGTPPESGS